MLGVWNKTYTSPTQKFKLSILFIEIYGFILKSTKLEKNIVFPQRACFKTYGPMILFKLKGIILKPLVRQFANKLFREICL